jgi:arabinan endo-1,5-alpha-L-arabinosidase
MTTRTYPNVLRAALVTVAMLVLALLPGPASAMSGTEARSPEVTSPVYANPIDLRGPDGEPVRSCADPSITYHPGDSRWYLYCTTDPLHGEDRDDSGNLNFRLIPIFSSRDLVSWRYEGDVFDEQPDWVGDEAGLWAPDVAVINGRVHVYYSASQTRAGGRAIGVAVSDHPAGPFEDAGAPVVEQQPHPCCEGDFRWIIDPFVLATDEATYLYFGSYFGGVFVRELSADGLSTDPATQTQVAIDNRYEGAYVVERDGYFYLFASATDCCRGPLTGYSEFVGRSASPLGPFTDRSGQSLLDGRVGGTPTLSMNGNRWVGTGHGELFTDFAGQDWLVYHAIDRHDPYFAGEVGFTRRPVLIDPVDWIDGWPTVRAGRWASDQPQAAPAAQPGQRSNYRPRLPRPDRPGPVVWADDFSGTQLDPAWSWVREPSPDTFQVDDGTFAWQTQAADLHEDQNSASVLTRPLPDGNWVADVRVNVDVPDDDSCCYNFAQGGLVIYGDDDNYLKLVHASLWNTRQVEFAKEEGPVPAGFPRYGNTVLNAPADWLWLRVVKTTAGNEARFTAYTSDDGHSWTRGGTWTHDLGRNVSLGLVSMGGAGFTSTFDEVTVSRLRR